MRRAGKKQDYLIGGQIATTETYPYLLGWNPEGTNDFKCTGVLITPSYFLSASHCLGSYFGHNQKNATDYCKKHGYLHDMNGLNIKCKILPKGGIELRSEPKGKVWINVDVVKNVQQMKETDSRRIKRHIHHEKTYAGKNFYAIHGGYDIDLIELEKPFSKDSETACLPGPDFDDLRRGKRDTYIAGYGKHWRETKSKENICQTNQYGQMKYHLCDKDKGIGRDACIRNKQPPIDDECPRFFYQQNTPDEFPVDFEEVKLQNEDGTDVKYCWHTKNPEDEAYGWCHTKGQYYNWEDPKPDYQGWGFCGKDCFEDNEPNFALRTSESKEVLSEEKCKEFLKKSVNPNVTVEPEILCIAEEKFFHETVWYRTLDKKYEEKKKGNKSLRFDQFSYVVSPGVCSGDSGGPSWVLESKRAIVTGET